MRKLQRWEGLGPSWVSLGASWEDLRASGEGLRASWEGLRARWEAPGGGRRKKKENGAFMVCGGAIGHHPLQGRCPKEHSVTRVRFQQIHLLQ